MVKDEKKTPLEDLLKSLEGHIVKSVEIRSEDSHMIRKISSNVELEILHVRISTIPRTDVSYPPHETWTRDLAFSIIDADNFNEEMMVIHTELQEIGSTISTTLSEQRETLDNLKERREKTSVTSISKLWDQVKGTILETLRIRKPEEPKMEA